MSVANRSVTVGGIVQPAGYEAPVFLATNTPVSEPVFPVVPAQIGEVVLFAIGPNLFRPLLVVALSEQGKVHGLLFLDGDKDRSAPWVKKWAFSPPTKTTPFQYVEGVRYGEGQGEWRKREILPIVNIPEMQSGLQQMGEVLSGNFDPRMEE